VITFLTSEKIVGSFLSKYLTSRSIYVFMMALICMVIGAAALFVSFYPAACSDNKRPAYFSYSAEPAEAGLKLSLPPIPSEMSSGNQEKEEMTVVLANNSEAAIESFSFESYQSTCVDFTPNYSTLRLPVPPHESAKILASVQARVSCPNGRYQLLLPYSWTQRVRPIPSEIGRFSHPVETTTQAAPESSYRKYVGFASSGPITVNTPFLTWTLCFAHLVSALFRNVMLPVVLAILGFAFQRGQSERDSAVSARNEAISRRSQIVNTMIPNYLEVVQLYYLPISRSFGRIALEAAAYFEKWGSPARLLASIVLMRKQLDWLANKRGGVYFISGTGEQFFNLLYRKFNERVHKNLNRDDLIEVVETLHKNNRESASFEECLKSHDFNSKLLPDFTKWIQDNSQEVQDCVVLTNTMRTILVFECSRPFYQTAHMENELGSSWYLDPPQIDLSAKLIFTTFDDDFQSQCEEARKEYLKGIPVECKAALDSKPPTVRSTTP
jgi:hypothetical protein